VGHRTAEGMHRSRMPFRGQGPDCIITDLGIFDFDSDGHAQLRAVYPDTSARLIAENTEFDVPVAENLVTADLPDAEMIEFIRRLDPMKIQQRELCQTDRERTFQLSGA
jgi:glutaconate CoA-transferase subunit B